MSEVKNRIFGALTVMSEEEANYLWEFISDEFSTWSSVETVEPDEFDIAMLREIENDPDCMQFE